MKCKNLCSLIVGLVLAPQVGAQERWVCSDYFESAWTTLLSADISEDGTAGTINVAGTTHRTEYEVAGFDRKWWWGSISGTGSYAYMFKITPRGTGTYYDFAKADEDGTVAASATFRCQSASS